MAKTQLGPWSIDRRDTILVLWICATYDAEGVAGEPGFISQVRRAYAMCLQKGLHLRDDEHFIQVLRQIGSCTPNCDPTWTIWEDNLWTPKGVRQYYTFLERMNAGNPPSSITSLWTRLHDSPFEANATFEQAVRFAPILQWREPDWGRTEFGPGAYTEMKAHSDGYKATALRRFYDLLTAKHPPAQVRCVPKNWKTDRIIAKMSLHDTVVHAPIAKALENQIQLQASGHINFHDQGVNRRRCNLAHDTIDFHAASDYNSIVHVEAVTDPKWHPLLNAVRTKSIEFDQKSAIKALNLSGPTTIPLQPMYSTMGCKLTFPLMSWVVRSLTIGFMRSQGALRAEIEEVYVFGDDLLVPHGWGERVINFFNSIGWVANTDKSFYESGVLFRETCGAETWNDSIITPLRIARGSNLGWWNSLTASQLAEFVTRCDERDLFFTNDLLIQEIVRYEGQRSSVLYRELVDKKGRPTGLADQKWVSDIKSIGVGDTDAPINCVSSFGRYRRALQSTKVGVSHRRIRYRSADGSYHERWTRNRKHHTIQITEAQIHSYGYRRMMKLFLAIREGRRTSLFNGKEEQRLALSAHLKQLANSAPCQSSLPNAAAIAWLLSAKVGSPLDEVPTDAEIEQIKRKDGWKK